MSQAIVSSVVQAFSDNVINLVAVTYNCVVVVMRIAARSKEDDQLSASSIKLLLKNGTGKSSERPIFIPRNAMSKQKEVSC